MSKTKFDRWVSMADKVNAMKGKRVLQVEVPDDSTARLILDDGTQWTFEVEGDCCSRSYFESNDSWKELEGSIIQDVEERTGGTKAEGEYGDQLQWDFLVFTTDKGHVTIQHNNSSNGYYSGYWIITGRE